MHRGPAETSTAGGVGVGPRVRHAGDHESRLRATLREDVTSVGRGLAVEVTWGCGTIEVRVAGSRAGLVLFFDPAEPASGIRFAVRKAVTRYASSLGLPSCERRGNECHGLRHPPRQLSRASPSAALKRAACPRLATPGRARTVSSAARA